MRVIHKLTIVMAALAVITVVVGHAAGLSGASSSLASGSSAVSRCDTDGVNVYRTISGVNVVGVWVWGIASACTGGTISITVNNGTTNSLVSATVPANGFVIATLGTPLLAKDVEQVDVVITGP